VKAEAEVTVIVRVTLDDDERFEAASPWGLKPRPVLIDKVKAQGGFRRAIIGSGRRVNKDGSAGDLRAAYVPLHFDQLPAVVQQEIDLQYAAAVQATNTSEEWYQ
jgi:hypothetical protein